MPNPIPPETFNLANRTLSSKAKTKHLFIELMRRMLRWVPEGRASARELYDNPWLDFRP
ncbi:hypothetical protein BDV12DRAFT_174680 [Aspergillus spectabilis]